MIGPETSVLLAGYQILVLYNHAKIILPDTLLVMCKLLNMYDCMKFPIKWGQGAPTTQKDQIVHVHVLYVSEYIK